PSAAKTSRATRRISARFASPFSYGPRFAMGLTLGRRCGLLRTGGGDAAGAGDLAEQAGRGPGGAGEGGAVHRDQAEGRPVGAPLVVVQGAPVQVAADVDAVPHRLGHGVQGLPD